MMAAGACTGTLTVTANTSWPAGHVSELEVYAP
jgi:hypothetical protein